MRTAALILMTLASVPHPTPLVSATLVGFLPQGDLLVLEKRGGGEEILRRLSHDGARSERIEGPKEALGVRAPTPLRQDRDRWRIRDLELVLIEEAPLGGRRSVELQARRAGHSIPIWRMPALSRVRVGPLYPVPNRETLIVAYAQSDREGLEPIDLGSVRAALLNLEAIDHFRAGDADRAAALLEEAIAIAPHAGDAVYNLACIHARTDQLNRAKSELSIALGIDRTRFRLLALDDPDLEPLREDPEVRRWLGLKDPD